MTEDDREYLGVDWARDKDGTVLVPEGVLEGIEDIAEGRTATAEDIDEVLKW